MRGLLAVALGSFAGGAAQAQPNAVRVALSWNAPAGCPAQADVEADVARRLGRPLATDGATLRANAQVESTARGYRLTLDTELEGESGTRLLEAPRCEELAAAASVIVALLADPHADATPAAKPPPPPQPTPKPKPEDEDEDEDDERGGEDVEIEEPEIASRPIVVHPSLRPELFADLGSMPKLAVGPALSVGVRLDRTALELTGSYLPPNGVDNGGRELGEVQLWSAALGVCHAFGERVAIGPCLRGEYGRMSGSGSHDVRKPDDGEGVFAAISLGLRLDYALLPALWLYAELDAGLPLARTIFTVRGVGPAHEPSPLIGRVRTGAELRF